MTAWTHVVAPIRSMAGAGDDWISPGNGADTVEVQSQDADDTFVDCEVSTGGSQ